MRLYSDSVVFPRSFAWKIAGAILDFYRRFVRDHERNAAVCLIGTRSFHDELLASLVVIDP